MFTLDIFPAMSLAFVYWHNNWQNKHQMTNREIQYKVHLGSSELSPDPGSCLISAQLNGVQWWQCSLGCLPAIDQNYFIFSIIDCYIIAQFYSHKWRAWLGWRGGTGRWQEDRPGIFLGKSCRTAHQKRCYVVKTIVPRKALENIKVEDASILSFPRVPIQN